MKQEQLTDGQHKKFFDIAAKASRNATCNRANCGTVIVKNGKILGEGWNSPPQNNEERRTCNGDYDYTKKPRSDLTCCIHAEWKAILNACKNFGHDIEGSTLYFMRTDADDNFMNAGEPYCTVCSRLAMEAGVTKYIVMNDNVVEIYDIAKYDRASYSYHLK